MRIVTMLVIAAGLVIAGAQMAVAQDNDRDHNHRNRPGAPGTIERDQGVIHPPAGSTLDRNQAQVPGTRDDPNAPGSGNRFHRRDRSDPSPDDNDAPPNR